MRDRGQGLDRIPDLPAVLRDYAQVGRVSTHSAGCYRWHLDCALVRAADEIKRLRWVIAEAELLKADRIGSAGNAGSVAQEVGRG